MVKDEGRLPTGSFKARACVSRYRWRRRTACGALRFRPTATPARRWPPMRAAGIEAYCFCADDTPEINLSEIALQGATVWRVNGLINDCARLVELGKPQFGWFDMSTLKEPYRIEGKKTMGLELAVQMDWRLPDVVFYPTGGGTGLIGMWKGWQELLALGWISGPCRVWSPFNPPAAHRSCARSRPEQTPPRPGRMPAPSPRVSASPRRWAIS